MEQHGISLSDICGLVEGRIHTFEDETKDRRVEKAFCSDLMSDVLTLLTDNLLLITGLNNVQAVRTAEMSDIGAILLVRGKEPNEKMVELAESSNIVLMSSPYSMYRAGGVLFRSGLGYVF
jgi:predicted transcriptional regulator